MEIRIEKINRDNSVMAKGFTVNKKDDLDSKYYRLYLLDKALSYSENGDELTFVALSDEYKGSILGYITLRASSLLEKNSYDSYYYGNPAIEIVNLAVDKRFEGHGVGSELITFALGVCNIVKEKFIGVEFLVVLSDPSAVNFYKRFYFGITKSNYSIPKDRAIGNEKCIMMGINLKCSNIDFDNIETLRSNYIYKHYFK